jgi:hypothetical protein
MPSIKTTSFDKTELETLIDALATAIDYHVVLSLPRLKEEDGEMLTELGYEWEEGQEPPFDKALADIKSRIDTFERMQNALEDQLEALS